MRPIIYESAALKLIAFRTKLIDDAKKPNPQYRGLVHGTMSIIKQEGISGIYRGLFPVVRSNFFYIYFAKSDSNSQMMRQGANSAIRFTTYSTLKQFVQGTARPGQPLPSAITFGIGGIAGLVTVYSTMPWSKSDLCFCSELYQL